MNTFLGTSLIWLGINFLALLTEAIGNKFNKQSNGNNNIWDVIAILLFFVSWIPIFIFDNNHQLIR